jgi:hypothetical protein
MNSNDSTHSSKSGKQPPPQPFSDSDDNDSKDEAVQRGHLFYRINANLAIVVLPDTGLVL